MKFFESKHYAPLVPLARFDPTKQEEGEYARLVQEQIIRDIVTIETDTGSFATNILSAYCARFPLLEGYRIVTQTVLDHWVPVTDLTCVRRRCNAPFIEQDLSDLIVRVYYHPKAEFFAIYSPSLSEDFYTTHLATLCLYVPQFVDAETGIRTLCVDGSVVRYDKPRRPEMRILTETSGSFSFTYNKLLDVDIDFDTMYPPEFKGVSNKIVEAVSDEESAGLIILHGDAGTGKTNYIRWLTSQSKRPMVFIPPNLVGNLTSPKFLSFLMKNKGCTFIVEDAEATLSPRLGAESSIVSTILNMTDGLLGDILKCQFLCTFNTELTNIDTALLRPGRLLVRQEFNKLTVGQSNKYLQSVDSSEVATRPMSLAELTNIKCPPTVSQSKPKTSFGFIN